MPHIGRPRARPGLRRAVAHGVAAHGGVGTFSDSHAIAPSRLRCDDATMQPGGLSE